MIDLLKFCLTRILDYTAIMMSISFNTVAQPKVKLAGLRPIQMMAVLSLCKRLIYSNRTIITVYYVAANNWSTTSAIIIMYSLFQLMCQIKIFS